MPLTGWLWVSIGFMERFRAFWIVRIWWRFEVFAIILSRLLSLWLEVLSLRIEFFLPFVAISFSICPIFIPILLILIWLLFPGSTHIHITFLLEFSIILTLIVLTIELLVCMRHFSKNSLSFYNKDGLTWYIVLVWMKLKSSIFEGLLDLLFICIFC